MIITLLRSFGHVGFKYVIDENYNFSATDGHGKELKEGVHYTIEDKDKIPPLMIIQANGLVAYEAPIK